MFKISLTILLFIIISSCTLHDEQVIINETRKTYQNLTKPITKLNVKTATFLRVNKHKKKCKGLTEYYEGYTNCITDFMRINPSWKHGYIYEVNNFETLTNIHSKLVKENIITQAYAFYILDKILKSKINLNKKVSFDNDFKLFQNCNNNKEFSIFISCLENHIRSTSIYNNSSFYSKTVIEQIIGYSLMFANNRNFKIDNFEIKKEFYSDNEKFFFELINYFASSYYEEKMEYLFVMQDNKYDPTTFDKGKQEYLKSIKSLDGLDVIDVALFVSTVYSLHQGDHPLIKTISKNKSSGISTDSITSSGKSSSVLSADNTSIYRKNMFRYAPKNSVLNKGWFKYGLLRGGF